MLITQLTWLTRLIVNTGKYALRNDVSLKFLATSSTNLPVSFTTRVAAGGLDSSNDNLSDNSVPPPPTEPLSVEMKVKSLVAECVSTDSLVESNEELSALDKFIGLKVSFSMFVTMCVCLTSIVYAVKISCVLRHQLQLCPVFVF